MIRAESEEAGEMKRIGEIYKDWNETLVHEHVMVLERDFEAVRKGQMSS